MGDVFALAACWIALAVLSSILARHLEVAPALVEICVGALAVALVGYEFGRDSMGSQQEWVRSLAAFGAVLLTFLSGAELDPAVLRTKWKESLTVGFVGFLAPFLGCAAVARWGLGWSVPASWLAGVALSTTSMAVVYAVMLETGLNRTEFGKGILAACFVNDLGTVVALGLLFAPFTVRTVAFVIITAGVLAVLPMLTHRMTTAYGHRTAAIRTKWIMFVLFGLGALALWAGSEAVLPAYLVGITLAGTAARDEVFIRRLRTLTVGFLTPFYFLRAGSLVSLPALLAAPVAVIVLLAGKVATKILGLRPVIGLFRRNRRESWYYTLLMSTGLTFGTISALYGLSHGIVTQEQYSLLVAVVIGSAVIPTLVASRHFLPHHLLPARPNQPEPPAHPDLAEHDRPAGRSKGRR
jgi:Kef-type K+ transport system membrane component KefB